MNEDVIADLKQFIAATVSQQMSGFVTKEDLRDLATKDDITTLKGEIAGVKADVARVEHKVDDLQEAVAEALNNANDAVEELIDKRLAEHVRRKYSEVP
jgi:fatty acid/phospholipid biosynthesis enzyme